MLLLILAENDSSFHLVKGRSLVQIPLVTISSWGKQSWQAFRPTEAMWLSFLHIEILNMFNSLSHWFLFLIPQRKMMAALL